MHRLDDLRERIAAGTHTADADDGRDHAPSLARRDGVMPGLRGVGGARVVQSSPAGYGVMTLPAWLIVGFLPMANAMETTGLVVPRGGVLISQKPGLHNVKFPAIALRAIRLRAIVPTKTRLSSRY